MQKTMFDSDKPAWELMAEDFWQGLMATNPPPPEMDKGILAAYRSFFISGLGTGIAHVLSGLNNMPVGKAVEMASAILREIHEGAQTAAPTQAPSGDGASVTDLAPPEVEVNGGVTFGSDDLFYESNVQLPEN